MRSVVVTGVSSGIGRAIATVLAGHGFRVFGSVRRASDAGPLQAALGERFVPLIFDVTDEAAVAEAAATVREQLQGQRLAGLVNNAGIAVGGPLSDVPIAQFRQQLEVNVTGPMIVTQAFLPLLGTDRTLSGAAGRIVNISSVAGKLAAPFLGAYVASKHALEGLSDSLRRELQFYGVDVIMVAPGHVATPIWDKAEEIDAKPFEQLELYPALEKFLRVFVKEGRRGHPPETVAEAVRTALTVRRPKVRYPVVPGHFMNWTVPRLLPSRTIDRVFAARFGLRPPTD